MKKLIEGSGRACRPITEIQSTLPDMGSLSTGTAPCRAHDGLGRKNALVWAETPMYDYICDGPVWALFHTSMAAGVSKI